MEDKNVIEGPSLERSIYTSAGEFLFSMLKMHDDKLLQVSILAKLFFIARCISSFSHYENIVISCWYKNRINRLFMQIVKNGYQIMLNLKEQTNEYHI